MSIKNNNIINYKPTSPGRRFKIKIRETILSKKKSFKNLTIGKKAISGRNHSGKITVYHRGGGHKRNIRILDKNFQKCWFSSYKIIQFEYDPNRSANIALCKILNNNHNNNNNNDYFYILAADGMVLEDTYYGPFHPEIDNLINFKQGSILPLNKIPLGSNIYNIQNTKYSQIGKAAGVSCRLLKFLNNKKAIIELPSKKKIQVSSCNLAQFGRVSNIFHNLTILGKAGSKRHLGFRPRVRGVAMNPIDHPMGGKTPVTGGLGGVHKTKWGKLAKWNKKK